MSADPLPIRVAVDIGGTFTDIEIHDGRSGRSHAHKTPSTPDDPSRGLALGLREAGSRYDFALADIGLLLHGTTIATNAVLERKLPRGAMLTTAGFEDVLEIGRHMRADLYSLVAERRPLLIPRERRFGVAERILFDGAVETPLDLAATRDLARRLVDMGVEALAIGFLNAYANPAHEIAALKAIAAVAPELALSASHEASPEVREFERFSTTALNALLKPVVSRYLEQVEGRLAEIGVTAPLYLVQSNGGLARPRDAARLPAKLLLSGPAGGAMALADLARRRGLPNLVGIDMGGTSADICVVSDHAVGEAPEGDIDGLPVRLPMIEIRTIGAGGGSIARVEAQGPLASLRVGPESAGAAPGPACYGRGGARPAVTDANVALGRIDAAGFLGGAMPLDRNAAAGALDKAVAAPLAIDRDASAAGVLEVADARMADAIRLSLFEKGADPADFALAPFGGAGGLHAAAIAEALDMRRIVFPANASTLSARGILSADLRHDLARSRQMVANGPSADAAVAALTEMAGELRAEGDASLDRDGVAPADRALMLSADMRYRGQAYELVVPWGEVAIDRGSLDALVGQFHEEHRRRFAHADPDDAVEIVTLRLAAIGRMRKPAAASAGRTAAGPPAPRSRRAVYSSGAWVDAAVYDRSAFADGAAVDGPCVVEEAFTTIYAPAGWRLSSADDGDLVAERTEQ